MPNESIDWAKVTAEELLKKLQEFAVNEGISDIHTSPEKDHVRVEVRRNGVLEYLTDLSHKTYIDFVRKVKFLSKLKLNITNVPQDGQYTFAAPGREVNIRVASIPSRFGETFTLRLLDPEKGIVPLGDLGFPKEIEAKLAEMIQLANGLILVSGPTGSGKTTTLYAMLSQIAGKDRNIITLEDPVEYELEDIVQSEVDHSHEYDFARGLRSILRHDPDVILVGEIRDPETAQTAIDAALTGHLVLSTIHTNSAIDAIPRFLSMGVNPYTFAPALRGILAQRMVRTLTDECKKEGAKCDPADHATYGGMTVLPELFVMSEALEDMIAKGAKVEEIVAKAEELGFKDMAAWGAEMVKSRITNESEIGRVTT